MGSFQSEMQVPADDESSENLIQPQVARLSRLADSPHLDLAISLGLMLLILAVYAQVVHIDFTDIDDPLLVSANPHVRGSFTADSIKWAFSTVVVSNWMPVTLLSHMLDCELFGVASGKHHLMNVLLHAISAVLLFMVLRRATGGRWPSAFVALLFALHPLHVESVAWVAEAQGRSQHAVLVSRAVCLCLLRGAQPPPVPGGGGAFLPRPDVETNAGYISLPHPVIRFVAARQV